MLALLTMLLTALTAVAQTTAVLTYSSTEGGTVSANTTSDYKQIESGASLAVGTEITLRVNLTEYDKSYIKGWTINGVESHPYLEEIRYTIQEGQNEIQAIVAPLPTEGFKVTYQAGPGGKISKAERMDENYNWLTFESGELLPTRKSVQLTAEPDMGYGIDTWTVNGKTQGSSTTLSTFTSTPLDIKVTFKEIKYYTVSFSTDEQYGRIQATYPKNNWDTQITTGTQLPEGTQVTFFVFPNDGYKVEKWIVNGIDQAPDQMFPQRLQKTLTEDLTVEAVLKKLPPKHTITLEKGNGGSIGASFVDPEDGYNASFDWQKDIQEGVKLTVRATPSPDYMVDKWYYNNQIVEPTAEDPNLYIFTVSEPATVYVTFKPGKSGYQVNYSAGEHGRIEKAEVYLPSGITSFDSGQSIPAGTTITLTAQPDKGYDVDQWYVNDEPQALYAGKPQCEIQVQRAMTVRVTFKKGAPAQYPVNFSVEGGIIVVKYKLQDSDQFKVIQSGDLVTEETELSVWVKPAGDNVTKEWYINNSLREDLAGQTEATVVVTGKTTIKVVCAAPAPTSYKLTYTAGANGSVTAQGADDKTIASGTDVAVNAKVTLTATPDEGYELEQWVVNGTARSDKALSIELTMDKEQVVEVTFVKKSVEYTLSYAVKPSDQGTLTVTDTKSKQQIASGSKVPEGTEITCQLSIPDGSKWQLERWTVNGSDYTEGAKHLTITLTVSKDMQIEAILLDHTSIETPQHGEYIVAIQEGQLIIDGLTAPTQVYLYDTTGGLLLARLVETTPVALGELPQGVYYLLIEGEVYKVIK